jgi:hypothetical protein
MVTPVAGVSRGWMDLGDVRVFRAGETFTFPDMIDTLTIDRPIFYIRNTSDQDVNVQVVGSFADAGRSLESLVNVGAPETSPAGSSDSSLISIGVDMARDGHPWLGLTISFPGPPPTDGGRIIAWVTYRELELRG